MKLFVGNLPWKVRVSDLETFLEERGVTSFVTVDVVLDRETGRSRGFGFVHFATEGELADAYAKLDGAELGGRSLRIDRATDRQRERDERGESPRGGSRGAPPRAGGGRRGRDLDDDLDVWG